MTDCIDYRLPQAGSTPVSKSPELQPDVPYQRLAGTPHCGFTEMVRKQWIKKSLINFDTISAVAACRVIHSKLLYAFSNTSGLEVFLIMSSQNFEPLSEYCWHAGDVFFSSRILDLSTTFSQETHTATPIVYLHSDIFLQAHAANIPCRIREPNRPDGAF